MTTTDTSPAPLYARAAYRGIELYAPDRRPASIDLSDNTNRWGVPPGALRELRDAGVALASRYPAVYSTPLKRTLADYAGVHPSMIVTGCGSDDVLDSAIRAFAEPGDRVVMSEPSFPMIPLFAAMNGLEYSGIPLSSSYDIDVESLVAGEPRITYLCSPNNPTGTTVARAAIKAVLAGARGIVIIDEAYVEFSDSTALDLVSAYDNLLIVRTMSKAFGLAGLRVGYAIGAPALVADIEKSRGPYKVSGLAERAAITALTEDLDWVREHIGLTIANRQRLVAALRARGLDVTPSLSNFVFAPVSRAPAVARRMREGAHGVAVRAFEGLRPVSAALQASGGCALRISVGPWPEIESALAAFDEAMAVCE
ncbi:MAG: aminotransferase class I/II-fold pyridoxal phosphate-dependent enzyme [bacterium]